MAGAAPANALRRLWSGPGWPRWTLGASIAATLALLAAVVWEHGGPSAVWRHWQAGPVRALVVEPFTGPPQWAEPLRDAVIDSLAHIPNLAILPKPAGPEVVTGVLRVSVERSPNRIRMSAEMRNVDGYPYWQRTFDRPIADLPDLPRQIADAVRHGLRRKTKPYRPALAPYDLYLEGRYHFDHADDGGLPTAVAKFESAAQLDPNFAEAWAWVSIAREYLADRGAVRPNLELPEAREAADRARALEPESAAAYLALGINDLQYDWDWEKARRELDRAIQLSPGWPLAAYWRQRWEQAMGHAPEPPFSFANLPPIQNPDDARRLLQNAEDIRVETYISAAALAMVANRIHDTGDTLRWLEQAYDERCVQLPYILRDPAMPHGDPRFDDLMRRMRLGGTE